VATLNLAEYARFNESPISLFRYSSAKSVSTRGLMDETVVVQFRSENAVAH
jgi:hypothetical protein